MMYQVKMQLKEMVDRCPVLNLKAFLVRGIRMDENYEYEDVPLFFRGSEKGTCQKEDVDINGEQKAELPEMIKEMKALYKVPAYALSNFDEKEKFELKSFYHQAEFMKDYEDDYVYTGKEIDIRYPVYHDLTDEMLRGYFGWRSRFKKGNKRYEGECFISLYAYELINCVGGDAAEVYKRFDELEAWAESEMLAIYERLQRWKHDFIVFYGLPIELLGDYYDDSADKYAISLINYKNSTDEEIAEAVEFFSDYKVAKSAYFSKNEEKKISMLSAVYVEFADYYANMGVNFFEKCFGKKTFYQYSMFYLAKFYHKSYKDRNRTVVISPVRRFVFDDEVCLYDAYQNINLKNPELGTLAQETDRILRKKEKGMMPLNKRMKNKQYLKMVEEAIEKREKLDKKRKVEIDFSKLKGIREDAAVTREKLIVDEAENVAEETLGGLFTAKTSGRANTAGGNANTAGDNANTAGDNVNASGNNANTAEKPIVNGGETIDNKANPEKMQNADDAAQKEKLDDIGKVKILTEIEEEYLRAVMEGLSAVKIKEIVQKSRKMESVLVDSINEKMYDVIGDSVLEEGAEGYSFVEDYREEVEELF
ncbi:MAG TPA: hypothetical protein DEO62_03960 [Lachnospiraceae bacterium]|nr:hypothetical protein [Lachnospiraceae bacterium]HBZ90157.1 hypothetical protein [Lachnospiraceae bacterium]